MAILNYLNLFVVGNLLLLGSILFLLRKKKTLFIHILTVLVLNEGAIMLLISLYNYPSRFQLHLTGLEYVFGYALGPLFILLTWSATKRIKKSRRNNMLLFVLPFCMLLFYIFMVSHPVLQLHFRDGIISGKSKLMRFLDTGVFFVILASIILCLTDLSRSRMHLKQFYSRFETLRITYLYRFFILQIILAPVAALSFTLKIKSGSVMSFGISVIINYFLVLYYIIKEPRLLLIPRKDMLDWGSDATEKEVDFEWNPNELVNKLHFIMDREKLYLNKEVSVSSIARSMNIPLALLQKVLLEEENTNLNDIITSYRLQYARDMIVNNEFRKYKIDAIAQLSGLTSRSVFYELFRKKYGMSPLQYRKHILTLT